MQVTERSEGARVPRHIAIIMDGNGRWAEERQRPRLFGHKAGVDSVREVVETARSLGVGSPDPLRLLHRKLDPAIDGSQRI
jgi:undecaprenyl pyrophosphate synthase